MILSNPRGDNMAELKKCSVDDVAELRAISIETFTDTFQDQNTEEDLQNYLNSAYNLEQLSTELQGEETDFYFVQDLGETVGYLKLNTGNAQSEYSYKDSLEVERIYVRPQHKRKGYGRILIDLAEQVAKEANLSGIWLGVWEHNPNAIAFYQKMGYERVGQHSFFMGEDEQVDYIMMKKI